jgi:hypothetical protein
LVLSPFEYRTAVIFQVLITTLNSFQTSGGLGESVLQMLQCPLSHQLSDACFFHSTYQTFCLGLQCLTLPQTFLIKSDPAWKQQEDPR